MTLLEDMVTYLTSAGVVVGDGVDTFRDFQPEYPDNIVSLHEYQGDAVSSYTNVVHRSVQIIARNKSSVAAQEQAKRIFEALLPTRDNMCIDFTSTRWGQVHLRQTPFKISQDEQDRTLYGFNLGITTTIE